MVTLPNMKIASLDCSKREKPTHAAMPNIGHGSMTASEPKMAHLGKETGTSFNVNAVDDNGLAKGFTSSFTYTFPSCR